MNICFLVNKQLTIYYASLARGLSERGHRVFWLSPSRRWSLWLLEQGFAAGTILSLADFGVEWQSKSEAESRVELAEIEGPGMPRIGNVILMDRALRRRPNVYALSYLAACRRKIEPFLRDNDIDVCIGEPTWAWEILVWMLGRRLGIRVLYPSTVRIPSDRFAFFDSVTHQIPTLREPDRADRQWAEAFLPAYRSRPRPPNYMQVIPSAFAFRRHWWKELEVSLLRPGLNRYDESIWPMWYRITYRARRAWNAFAATLFCPFFRPGARSEIPFVLFCLHHQPEASIDVFASLHSNQEHVIGRLARLLPATHQLWVKEHPTGIGDRSYSQLSRLARIPGVRLVRPEESTFDLVRRADLIIAPSGTVAYEAALLGKHAVTLAPLFFNPIMSIDAARFPDPLNWPLYDILTETMERDLAHESRIVGFLAWLHAQSFVGMPCDSVTQRMFNVDSEESVGKVLAGFDKLLTWPRLRLATFHESQSMKHGTAEATADIGTASQ